MKVPLHTAALSLGRSCTAYPSERMAAAAGGDQLRPQARAAHPAWGVVSANSCDTGVKNAQANGTLELIKDWHKGGQSPFVNAEHVTVRYYNRFDVAKTCHVFDLISPKSKTKCNFTTCT